MARYYAQGMNHKHIGINSFVNVRGGIYVFNTRQERDDFVRKYEWYWDRACAKAITRDEARRLLCTSSLTSSRIAEIDDDFFGDSVKKLVKN